MFKQRLLTALVLAPLALGAVFYLPPVGFAIFLGCAFLIAAWEWASFCGWQTLPQRISFTVGSAFWYLLCYQALPQQLAWPVQTNLVAEISLWSGVGWWLAAVLLVLSFGKTKKFWQHNTLLRALMGWLTLVPSFAAILLLRNVNFEQSTFTGAWLICMLLGLVWAADIGGYVIGKPFGKHKLLPEVSPGKTLEGMIGGLVFVMALLTGVAVYLQWPDGVALWYLAALLLTLLSVFGDLSESMFKRVAGLKDSGSIFPGHGGIMDRIDSLTATAPLFALFVAMLGGF